MVDTMTAEQRHRCMSHIRSRDTRPETMVRHYLFYRGFRYRKNVRALPGTPDIVLGRYRTVIFVNGCFWHGHEGCRYFRLPKTNAGFWQQKIERNQARDARDRMELRRMGWHVIQVWECQLKSRERAATLRSIEQTLCGIYLDDNAVERTDISLAAEDETPYNNSLHNK